MKFKEAYELWKQGVKIKGPVCNEEKVNLFEGMNELEQLPDKRYSDDNILSIDRQSFEYYNLYLQSCGEIEKPRKPFISYKVYVLLYAKMFEPDLRKSLINRSDTNETYCKWFNIPVRYNGITFDTMKDYPEQLQLKQTTRNWIRDGWKDCLLLGSKYAGIGKTTMLVCSAMERFVQKDYNEIKRFEGPMDFLNSSIIFLKERQLVNLISGAGVFRVMILERLASVDYFVYDDLLSMGDKVFSKTVLFDILDSRVEDAGKPTAISTRMSQENLKRYHPDIYSRIARGKIYYSNSKKDIRPDG